jgi:hypothetical protein
MTERVAPPFGKKFSHFCICVQFIEQPIDVAPGTNPTIVGAVKIYNATGCDNLNILYFEKRSSLGTTQPAL